MRARQSDRLNLAKRVDDAKKWGKAFAATTLLSMLCVTGTATAAIFVVNSTSNASDASPGNGLCATTTSQCTFRAAIEESNARPGYDEIRFSGSLPKIGGIVQFLPSSPYPPLTDRVLINGYSHPDYDGSSTTSIPNPMINLVGSNAGPSTVGIDVWTTASGSTIRGLAVAGFSTGIRLNGTRPIGTSLDVANVILQGNHIGILRGSLLTGNIFGVSLFAAQGNLIGESCGVFGGCSGTGNLISANEVGIHVSQEADGNRIAGNFIGTDRFGLGTYIPFSGYTGNTNRGIWLTSSVRAEDFRIGSIGSTYDAGTQTFTPVAAGNVISGNDGTGVVLEGEYEAEFQANMIGVNRTGTAAVPNGINGISALLNTSVASLQVGTDGIGGNVISGNDGNGFECSGASHGTVVTLRNNKIGTNASGTTAIPNDGDGIDANCDVLIQTNTIGGNGEKGIYIRAYAEVQNNWIGVNQDGDPLPNSQDGIFDAGVDALIGGAGFGNVIGFNDRHGIYSLGRGTTIQGNYVGTDSSGQDLGNQNAGIRITPFTTEGFEVGGIDGLVNGLGNVIGHNNSNGISLYQNSLVGPANAIHGNYFGTDPSGRDLGNRSEAIRGNVNELSIGAPLGTPDTDVARHANIFANSDVDAIRLDAAALEVTIRGNHFRKPGPTSGRHIRHGWTEHDGLNDVDDYDEGPNRLQNFPEMDQSRTFLNAGTGDVEIRYLVDSDPVASAYPLRVDFYVGDPAPSSDEIVAAFIGSDSYGAASAGDYETAVFLPIPGTIAPDAMGNITKNLYAIATDADGNSSEVSAQAIQLPEPGMAGALMVGIVGLAGLARRRESRHVRRDYRPNTAAGLCSRSLASSSSTPRPGRSGTSRSPSSHSRGSTRISSKKRPDLKMLSWIKKFGMAASSWIAAAVIKGPPHTCGAMRT